MKSKAKIKPQTKNQAQDTETRLMVARGTGAWKVEMNERVKR